ncbi:MAG: restriction endonuclease [Chloroflexi bacterium]|nr:restriction endonuclease [Chloroflexota bacterium]
MKYFVPVLSALRDLGNSGTPSEVYDLVAKKLNLPESVLNQQLKNGSSRYENQVAWARFYLTKGKYLDASKRGVWSLTEKGKNSRLTDEEALGILKKLRQEMNSSKSIQEDENFEEETEESTPPQNANSTVTPTRDYRTALLETLRKLPSEGFEQLSKRLLREAGFQQVEVTGRTRDGGIDGKGILQLNSLLSFQVIFQCKRYSGVVSASEMRDFRGTMTGRTDKGIFLTTGTFSAEARKEAQREGVPPIELVDAEKLVSMFEQLELGLVPKMTYEIDERFFQEFSTQKKVR